jgi:hypothetical protein
MKIENRENGEYSKGDDFLNGFELRHAELIGTDAVGRDLEAVFEKSDHPADDDHLEQRGRFVFQVAVPGKCHEDVGTGQEQDRSHAGYVARFAKVLPEPERLFCSRGADSAPAVNLAIFVPEAELLSRLGDGTRFRAGFRSIFHPISASVHALST